MSEKSKGSNDTYATAGLIPTRIPQNPLLSASITGLSLDDFPNQPLILPPAPPIVHLPPKPTASPLGIIGSETTAKQLVTLGKSSNIDSESLDEVNLNTTSTTAQFSQIDANSNPLSGDTHPDSILSQAASSFSALPSVASTVFSTFSKRLYAGSNNSREPTPDIQNQPTNNQENFNNFNTFPQQELTIPQPTFYDQSNNNLNETNFEVGNLNLNFEPPKLYSPAQIPSQPSVQSTPPLAAAGQNTYRLTAKKKHYAPIPGLSGQGVSPAAPTPLQANNQIGSSTFADSYQLPSQPTTEQSKGSGLFSLSNLAPSGILQNISGLVQSATSTIQPVNKPQEYLETNSQQLNYFGYPNQTETKTSSQTYFVAPETQATNTNFSVPVPNSVSFFFNNHSQTQESTVSLPPTSSVAPPSFFTPQTVTSGVEVASEPIKPPTVSGGPSTLRLQKGTKLYKNPLTAAELTATPNAPAFSAISPAGATNFFVPNTASTGQETSVGSAVNFFTPQQQPEVSLVSPQQHIYPTSPVVPPQQNIYTTSPIVPPQQNIYPNSPIVSQTPPQQNINPISPIVSQTPPQQNIYPNSPIVSEHTTNSHNQQNLFNPTPQQSLFYTPENFSNWEQQKPSLVPTNSATQEQYSTKSSEEKPVDLFPISSPQSTTNSVSNFEEKPIDLFSVNSPQSTTNSVSNFEEKPIDLFPINSSQSTTNSDSNSEVKPIDLFSVNSPQPKVYDSFLSPENSSVNKTEEKPIDLFPINSPQPTVEFLENKVSEIDETPEAAEAANEIDPLEETIKKLVLDSPAETEPYFSVYQETKSELPTFTPEKPTAPPFDFAATNEPKESSVEQPLLPPPAKPVLRTEANPFRRNSGVAAILPTKTGNPTLASFFTPVDTQSETVGDFNIFSAENSSRGKDNFNSFFDQPTTDIAVAPPTLFTSNTTTTALLPENIPTKNVPPPLGFDNVVAEVEANNKQNFFNDQQRQQPINTKQFFDNIVQPPTVQQQENQRLQNFFNNPPLNESCDASNDLSYALIHSGVPVRNIESSSYSNIVEPPSSACSELTTEIKQNLDLNLKQSFETNINKTADNSFDITYLPEEVLAELKMANLLTGEKGAATDPPAANIAYKPAVKHWFYKQANGANKYVWVPFSHYDSALLETSLNGEEKVIAVEGGRYDVDIIERIKMPVYWGGEKSEVRRCSWFYKSADSKYIPYEEETADLLEEEYKQTALSGEWHKKVMLACGEQIVFHSAGVIVHFQQQQNADAWGGSSQTSARPRVVKRDLDEFTIEQGESQRVDHLLFMVHGIGSACDLRMRTIEEVVSEFRRIAAQLVQSHYKHAYDLGQVGRVEVLPISWHQHLHSTEIDEKLKSITLESIPKLRNFTNDTLLDVLFYTSPTYCQKIMNAVVTSMNTVYAKYCERNPEFNGSVSLAGHSLGSLIIFDLLCHQECAKESEEQNLNPENGLNSLWTNQDSSTSQFTQEIKAKQISYAVGPAGTGQPFINYPQINFHPKKFFALGSPIGMFVTIRGIDNLGLDFRLPTCSGFYNIFHPFDPVAYRIEALVNPDMSGVRPVLIPHHKGRKRMHLELKETMTRVSVDLKQRLVDTFKNTLGSVNFLGNSPKQNEEEDSMASEVNKVIEMQKHLEEQQIQMTQDSHLSLRSRADSTSSNAQSDHDAIDLDMPLGKLNDAKRIDYVLQEAPLEFFNEYLFALGSHVCYWNSADTILFVMKEIYSGLGVTPDNQVPQHSMTIERPSSRSSFSQQGQSP